MLRSFILGAACVLLSLAPAQARPTRTAAAEAEPPAAEAASPIRPVAATTPGDGTQVCGRSRRRLWLDGEGWVVRKVSTCR